MDLNSLSAYHSAWLAVGVLGLWIVVQVLVADVLAILAKHTPGAPVDGGHASLLFRATRAHANSLENAAPFLLLLLFAVGVSASAQWTAWLAWAFVATRLVHGATYYANIPLLRSAAFGLSLLPLLGLFFVGLRAHG